MDGRAVKAFSTRFLKALTGFAALAMAFVGASAQATDLLDVRFGPDNNKTRVVFDLSGNADYVISGDSTGQGRIFIDFSALDVPSANLGFKPGKGHILRFGFAAGPGGGARAVLELKTTAKIKAAFMLPPKGGVAKHRLVLDLETADMAAFLESLPQKYADLAAVIEQATSDEAKIADAAPETAPGASAAPTPPEKITVVVDAGHGGSDPGAQGQSGTYEKAVTLAAAAKLAEILEKRQRYDVVMTRTGDTKIKPDERESLARKAGADLFISLHADAIAQEAVRGASVYTLSEQGTARSASLAKSEGDYVVYDLNLEEWDGVVGDILLDKAQDMTNTASANFAQILISNLSGKTPLLNRSHRTGDLRVLLAPDVPAVLLEMAFISNAKDEANLNSPVWRERAMTAVADSIDAYFDSIGLSRHAAAETRQDAQ